MTGDRVVFSQKYVPDTRIRQDSLLAKRGPTQNVARVLGAELVIEIRDDERTQNTK